MDAGEFAGATVTARGAKAHIIGGGEAQSVRVAQATVAGEVYLVDLSNDTARGAVSAWRVEAGVAELARWPGKRLQTLAFSSPVWSRFTHTII